MQNERRHRSSIIERHRTVRGFLSTRLSRLRCALEKPWRRKGDKGSRRNGMSRISRRRLELRQEGDSAAAAMPRPCAAVRSHRRPPAVFRRSLKRASSSGGPARRAPSKAVASSPNNVCFRPRRARAVCQKGVAIVRRGSVSHRPALPHGAYPRWRPRTIVRRRKQRAA